MPLVCATRHAVSYDALVKRFVWALVSFPASFNTNFFWGRIVWGADHAPQGGGRSPDDRASSVSWLGFSLGGLPMRLRFYALQCPFCARVPVNLFCQAYKNELYLSANLRLCGTRGMAHVDSSALAEQFRAACMAPLRKRYGDDFDLAVVECESPADRWTQEKIARDSALIQARLATGNFRSNSLRMAR